MRKSTALGVGLVCLVLFNLQAALAQGTVFTYQGRLSQNGVPLTGTAEIAPTLWDAASGGNPVATNNPATLLVAVSNGLFSASLDFGSAPFAAGAARWLQLGVRTTMGPFTILSPLQPLTATPYAITAGYVTTAVTATSFSGPLAGDVTGTQGATVVSGVGGQTAVAVADGASAANAATSANMANTIVKRDASGNFSAGAITASLSGSIGTNLTTFYQKLYASPGSSGYVTLTNQYVHEPQPMTGEWRATNSTFLAFLNCGQWTPGATNGDNAATSHIYFQCPTNHSYFDMLFNPYHDYTSGAGASEMQISTSGGIAISTAYGSSPGAYASARRAIQLGIGGYGQPYIYHQYSLLMHSWETNVSDTAYPIFYKSITYTNLPGATPASVWAGSVEPGDSSKYPAFTFRGYNPPSGERDGSGAFTFYENLDYMTDRNGQWLNMETARKTLDIIVGPSRGLNINGAVNINGSITINGAPGITTNYTFASGENLIISNGIVVYFGPPIPYAWDADAKNYLAFIGNSTSTTNVTATTVNTLVANAKAHGWWTKCDAIYPLVGGTSNTMCWNLKDTNTFKLLGVNASASVWRTNGLVGNGTAYIGTQYTPSTAGGSYTLNSSHMMVCTATNKDGAIPIGTFGGSSRAYVLIQDSTYMKAGGFNNDTVSDLKYTGTGFILGSRTSSTNMTLYLGATGSSLWTISTTTLPTRPIDILSCNYDGDHSIGRKAGLTVLAASIGGGIDASVVQLMSQDWQNFNSALGR
jgi:hypothetical protein